MAPTLIRAFLEGDRAAIPRLLLEGADPAERYEGKTVFHLAAQNSDLKTCEALLRAGVPVDLRDDFGRTPLRCAYNSLDCTRLLLRWNADPNATDTNGNTPFHAPFDDPGGALIGADEVEAKRFSLLITAGGDGDVANLVGSTPLYLCAEFDLPTAFETLIAAGADPIRRSPWGATLFHAVASCRVLKMSEEPVLPARVLALGLDINAADDNKLTPLDYATSDLWEFEFPNEAVIAWLLSHGAKPSE